MFAKGEALYTWERLKLIPAPSDSGNWVIKSFHNKYFRLNGDVVVADGASADSAEEFEVWETGDGYVYFKSASKDKYVRAVGGGGAELRADQPHNLSHERFKIYKRK